MRKPLLLSAFAATLVLAAWWWWQPLGSLGRPAWSPAELALVESLWINHLPPAPATPSNAVASEPRAAEFGQQLFFDTRLSGTGTVSCATCHQPERHFTDGRMKGLGIGESARNTRSIEGAAWSPWLYWDGRRDSLWSQALVPLEDPQEHGADRMQLARLLSEDLVYRAHFEALFGALPDLSDRNRFPWSASPRGNAAQVAAWQLMTPEDQRTVNRMFASIGKALEAFERLLAPGPSRFDAYVEALREGDVERQMKSLSRGEVRGLRLFIGKARCIECHNGPLLTNNEFHNTGLLPLPGEFPDRGRINGVREVLADPFNCLGGFSDDPKRECPELRFARTSAELLGAMRTPSLRNLPPTSPFMHKGQLATLGDVIEHYNTAPLALIGHNEAEPLNLSRREIADLEMFLLSLSAPVDWKQEQKTLIRESSDRKDQARQVSEWAINSSKNGRCMKSC